MINNLEKTITGKGEVKGYTFNQKKASQYAYIYEVTSNNGMISHYEVFERKNSAICIDFDNRIYSETEFKESYPKANSFGVWAWSCKTLYSALDRFDMLNERIELKNKTNEKE